MVSDEYERQVPPRQGAEAREALTKCEVPVLAEGLLAAVLNGSIAEFADSGKHAARCKDAGENVVPFPLRRRWPRRAVSASELTSQEIEAIRTAEPPPGYEHLDAELEGWNPPTADHEGD